MKIFQQNSTLMISVSQSSSHILHSVVASTKGDHKVKGVLGRRLMKMNFWKPRSLRSAMWPTLLASWTFGMGVFEYPTFCPRRLVSICCLVIHCTVYLALSFSTYVTSFDVTPNDASSGITHLCILAKIICIAVIMCRGQAKSAVR